MKYDPPVMEGSPSFIVYGARLFSPLNYSSPILMKGTFLATREEEPTNVRLEILLILVSAPFVA